MEPDKTESLKMPHIIENSLTWWFLVFRIQILTLTPTKENLAGIKSSCFPKGLNGLDFGESWRDKTMNTICYYRKDFKYIKKPHKNNIHCAYPFL